MARVFITGSADGLGRAAAQRLRLVYLSSGMHRGGRARLATCDDSQARTSGGYWHHQHRAAPAPAVREQRFQDELLESLARFTATRLPQQN